MPLTTHLDVPEMMISQLYAFDISQNWVDANAADCQ